MLFSCINSNDSAFWYGVITEWLSPMPSCVSDGLVDIVYLIGVLKLADAVGMADTMQVRVD